MQCSVRVTKCSQSMAVTRPYNSHRLAAKPATNRTYLRPGQQQLSSRVSLRKSVVTHAGAVTDVDEATLEFEIANRDRPIIVDFYATWCGPCLLMADELKKVAAQLGDEVKILKLDTDKNPNIASALQIQGLPTLVFVGIDPEKPALRTEGLLPAQTIVDIVRNEIGNTGSPAPEAAVDN